MCQIPAIRIDPWSLLWADILYDGSIVLRMGGFGPQPSVCRGLGDMPLLSGDSNEPATGLRQQIPPMLF